MYPFNRYSPSNPPQGRPPLDGSPQRLDHPRHNQNPQHINPPSDTNSRFPGYPRHLHHYRRQRRGHLDRYHGSPQRPRQLDDNENPRTIGRPLDASSPLPGNSIRHHEELQPIGHPPSRTFPPRGPRGSLPQRQVPPNQNPSLLTGYIMDHGGPPLSGTQAHSNPPMPSSPGYSYFYYQPPPLDDPQSGMPSQPMPSPFQLTGPLPSPSHSAWEQQLIGPSSSHGHSPSMQIGQLPQGGEQQPTGHPAHHVHPPSPPPSLPPGQSPQSGEQKPTDFPSYHGQPPGDTPTDQSYQRDGQQLAGPISDNQSVLCSLQPDSRKAAPFEEGSGCWNSNYHRPSALAPLGYPYHDGMAILDHNPTKPGQERCAPLWHQMKKVPSTQDKETRKPGHLSKDWWKTGSSYSKDWWKTEAFYKTKAYWKRNELAFSKSPSPPPEPSLSGAVASADSTSISIQPGAIPSPMRDPIAGPSRVSHARVDSMIQDISDASHQTADVASQAQSKSKKGTQVPQTIPTIILTPRQL